MLVVSVFFLFMIPHAFSLNFIFTSFKPNDYNNISFELTADIAEPYLYLVANQKELSSPNSQGRATYHEPMHSWDKATRKLANFDTNFNFTIESQGGRTSYADGMAFFLAPVGSKLPDPPEVGGGSIGLIIGDNKTLLNLTDHPFVAVEFDIFPNEWDPPAVHVGVDINSVKSVTMSQLYANITEGRSNEAFISYNAITHNLSISFTGFDRNNNIVWQHLHHIVDLRKYLPELVTFGFSAATGTFFATHRINTWSFNSDDFLYVPPSPSPRPSLNLSPNPSRTSRNTVALATGLGVGGLVLVCGVVLFVLWKKKRRKDDDESNENMSDDFEIGTGPKMYPYDELASSTNYFKDQHKLGQGGFGGVYKGFLKDSSSYVAIKRISKDSKQGKKEFALEVRIINQLRHRNLVQLIGWCHEKKELLLVYEYMPNGSLDSHLFKNQRLLIWSVRFENSSRLGLCIIIPS